MRTSSANRLKFGEWDEVKRSRELKKAVIVFFILYALLTGYSILNVALGLRPFLFFTPLTTLAGFMFALLHACQREGWKRAMLMLAFVFVVSLFFESVGVATGLIYGPYHYTDMLGPKFLDLVPFLIPVAWFMMSYPSFVIADWLVPFKWKRWQRLFAVAAVGGIVMTAWDIVMDPIMVYNGHWVWDVAGAYHGIPLQNFWGWWLTVFTTYALYMFFAFRGERTPQPRFDRLAVSSYLVTTLGMVLSSLFGGAGELGLIGIFVMTPWVIAGLLKMSDNCPKENKK
jgi:uncharacterized membrane protein